MHVVSGHLVAIPVGDTTREPDRDTRRNALDPGQHRHGCGEMDAVAGAVVQQEGADGVHPRRGGGLEGVGESVGGQVFLDGLRLGAVGCSIAGDLGRQVPHPVRDALRHLQGLPACRIRSRAGGGQGRTPVGDHRGGPVVEIRGLVGSLVTRGDHREGVLVEAPLPGGVETVDGERGGQVLGGETH